MKKLVWVVGFIASCTEESALTKPTNASFQAYTRGNNCQIIRVVDGDTVKANCDGQEQNLRLLGFDTPETFRSGCADEKNLGMVATNHLKKQLISADTIRLQIGRPDKYRRLLTTLYIDGRDVADIMIEAGLAVPYHGEKRINWCDRIG